MLICLKYIEKSEEKKISVQKEKCVYFFLYSAKRFKMKMRNELLFLFLLLLLLFDLH